MVTLRVLLSDVKKNCSNAMNDDPFLSVDFFVSAFLNTCSMVKCYDMTVFIVEVNLRCS